MKAQCVAWILAGSLFMFGCGSDAGGPESSATSTAEIGACTGEGCPSDCRQVTIKTAFGKSVALCDDTQTANDGNGSSTHEEPPIVGVGVGVGVETVPDAGVHNTHVAIDYDAGPTNDASTGRETDAGGAHADGGAGHEADAGAGHEADAGVGHQADAGHELDAGDAGGESDGGGDTDAGDAGPGADTGVADGGCGAP